MSRVRHHSKARREAPKLLLAGATLLVSQGASAQPMCADPTRVEFLEGGSACRVYDGNPTACVQAWSVTLSDGTPVNCFYTNNTCQGCGPVNQAQGHCVNTCLASPALAPALPLAGAFALGLGLVLFGRSGAVQVTSRRRA